jgi:hypothetical protein
MRNDYDCECSGDCKLRINPRDFDALFHARNARNVLHGYIRHKDCEYKLGKVVEKYGNAVLWDMEGVE